MRSAIPVVLCLACTPSSDRHVDPALSDPADWQATDAHDPFPSHRPSTVDCPPESWFVEGGGLEVDTGVCNYFAAFQPLRVELPAGTPVHLFLFHDSLRAPQPAEAHVALTVGDETLWETRVAIPADATPYEATVTVQDDHDVDEPLAFHLHNHGANTWTLLELERADLPSP